jgi:hypothetical protein
MSPESFVFFGQGEEVGGESAGDQTEGLELVREVLFHSAKFLTPSESILRISG